MRSKARNRCGMADPLPPMVSRARAARRFHEPSQFGRTVSTISIAAKIAACVETRSEGQDGATGGFGVSGHGPIVGDHRYRARGRGLGHSRDGSTLYTVYSPRAHVRASELIHLRSNSLFSIASLGRSSAQPPPSNARTRGSARVLLLCMHKVDALPGRAVTSRFSRPEGPSGDRRRS
jgi:hypothetical protein